MYSRSSLLLALFACVLDDRNLLVFAFDFDSCSVRNMQNENKLTRNIPENKLHRRNKLGIFRNMLCHIPK